MPPPYFSKLGPISALSAGRPKMQHYTLWPNFALLLHIFLFSKRFWLIWWEKSSLCSQLFPLNAIACSWNWITLVRQRKIVKKNFYIFTCISPALSESIIRDAINPSSSSEGISKAIFHLGSAKVEPRSCWVPLQVKLHTTSRMMTT